MAYSTIEDIQDQLPERTLIELTDDAGAGTVDEDVVTRAIADADAEIDGYVSTRHLVPLDPVPTFIRRLSVDLAIYHLYSRREAIPEARAERRTAAVKSLQAIAKGEISLGANDPEGSPTDADQPRLADSNPTRIFSRDNLKDF